MYISLICVFRPLYMDAWQLRRQTHVYLPSRRTLLSYDWY